MPNETPEDELDAVLDVLEAAGFPAWEAPSIALKKFFQLRFEDDYRAGVLACVQGGNSVDYAHGQGLAFAKLMHDRRVTSAGDAPKADA